MSKGVIIRQAESRDVPNVTQLFDRYRRFYKLQGDIPGAERFIGERLHNKESVIFVAESSQGDLVGFIQLYPAFTSLGMARSWTLNDLYVVETARRLGIGHLLMRAAEDLARSSNARSINLETQLTNTSAQSLYEGLGYQPETDFRFYSKTMTPPPVE